MRKKAQTALEYLATYGWAIVILLIVTAILWYMGFFNSLSFAGNSFSAAGFSSFTHIDHQVKTNSATIILVNSVTRQITVTSATVGSDDTAADTACNTGLPKTLSPNANITITCNSIPQGVEASHGAPYDLNVIISFTDSVSGNAHTDIGYIRGKVE